MYDIGDLIVYGSTGVCRVRDITTHDSGGADDSKKYYLLEPLYQKCTIYSPVENPKVFMRPIISAEEANRLIDTIPTVNAEAYHNSVLRQLVEHYDEIISRHDCGDLIELTMSIYAKREYMRQQNRKFGQIDERFMRKAEELLYGELSAALGIKKDEVPEYIKRRLGKEAMISKA